RRPAPPGAGTPGPSAAPARPATRERFRPRRVQAATPSDRSPRARRASCAARSGPTSRHHGVHAPLLSSEVQPAHTVARNFIVNSKRRGAAPIGRKARGLTLIEIMVVVVILGILAAIVAP